MAEIYKDRVIPIEDFFKNKQLEYISYKLTYLLWDERFKEKYDSICTKIEVTIDSISERNGFINVFQSCEEREKYINYFFKDKIGFPEFRYKNAYQKKTKAHWDKIYYFGKDSEIVYKNEKGICHFVDTEEDTAIIIVNKNRMIVPIEELQRGDIDLLIPKIFIKNGRI